jgi:hypothetical protein
MLNSEDPLKQHETAPKSVATRQYRGLNRSKHSAKHIKVTACRDIRRARATAEVYAACVNAG